MQFLKSRKKPIYKFIIGVKSSSITIQIVSIAQNKREVLFFKQCLIFLENSQDSDLYTKQFFKEFDAFLKQNQTVYNNIIKDSTFEVEYILYAPWFTSNIHIVEESKSSQIDQEFLQKKLNELSIPENLTVLERQIIKIEANGYTLTSIKKINYPNVKLTAYSSYISKDLYTKFQKIILDVLPRATSLNFSTSSLSTLQYIKKYMVREDNITFLHIHEEITEVSIIQDDSLVFLATFPIGIHDFLREIQTNIKTYDYDSLYQKQFLLKSPDMQEKFTQKKQHWVQSLEQTLSIFNTQIPHKIFLICPAKTKDLFTECIYEHTKQNPNTILKNNKVINFDISVLKDIIEYKIPVKDTELSIVLEALI